VAEVHATTEEPMRLLLRDLLHLLYQLRRHLCAPKVTCQFVVVDALAGVAAFYVPGSDYLFFGFFQDNLLRTRHLIFLRVQIFLLFNFAYL
jgi:hypothetical protein